MSRLQHVAGTRLGVEWSISRDPCWGAQSPPARAGSMDGPGGLTTSSCLSRGGPWGLSGGDWAHPRPAITHAPRGAFPLKNQTGATKFKNRPSPRPPDGRMVRKFYYPRVQNWLELRENKPK